MGRVGGRGELGLGRGVGRVGVEGGVGGGEVEWRGWGAGKTYDILRILVGSVPTLPP